MNVADKGGKAPDFIMVKYTVFIDPDLTAAEKLLFSRLDYYAGSNGKAYPKHETLAREMCLKERQVRRLLENLRDLNRITWKRTRTSCIYEIRPVSEWTRMSNQERARMSTLTGRGCPIKSGHGCPIEEKYRSSSLKKKSGKKPGSKVGKGGATATENQDENPNPKPFSSKVDDDEKLTARTPFENSEMEFNARIMERHGNTVDVDRLLQIVRSELDCGPLSEFLEEDSKTTTAPGDIRNPGAYYRDLARKVMRGKQAAGLEWITSEPLRVPEMKFVPSCTACHEGKLPTGDYCGCKVGDVVREMDERNKAVA